MNQSLLDQFGNAEKRIKMAIMSLRNNTGVLIIDQVLGQARGHLVFGTEGLTLKQTATMIREGAGLIYLCLPPEQVRQLDLPLEPAVHPPLSGISLSIDSATGIRDGVSALDRLTTIKAATAPDAAANTVRIPGHVFPRVGIKGGVLAYPGPDEAVAGLMWLAHTHPCAVRSELMARDGSLAALDQILEFGMKAHIPVIEISDLAQHMTEATARAV